MLLRTIIGVNPEERINRQDVLINVVCYTNTRKAGNSDDIKDALDYRNIHVPIAHLVENSKFFLIERMAEEIANLCLVEKEVRKVRVTVEKPGALPLGRSVGITIERARK